MFKGLKGARHRLVFSTAIGSGIMWEEAEISIQALEGVQLSVDDLRRAAFDA